MSETDRARSAPGHVVPMRVLATVFGLLVLLTALTVAAAEVDLGRFNLYVALGIAGLKASLVALFFMHLRYDRPFHAVVFLGCLLFVVIFISIVLTDTQTYFPSISSEQAPAMQAVHTPFGR